jgi:hypothetical protein
MTLASATKDFAFDSGATKLPTIRDRDPLLTLQFGVFLFAFYLFCEIETATLRLVSRVLG